MQAVWQRNGYRSLVTEVRGMQLVVSWIGENRAARFLIKRRARRSSGLFPVQSGHRESVEQAMEAAEQMAERL